MRAVEDFLFHDGFCTISSVLSEADARRLADRCRILLDGPLSDRKYFAAHRSDNIWQYGAYTDKKTSLAVDIIGQDAELDALLEKVFSAEQVRGVLHMMHGSGFKVTQVNVRKVVKGDPGLGFHQDTHGETGMGIFLSDWNSIEGTTVFIPNSHRWPFSIRQLLFFPRIPVSWVPRKWFKAANGNAGDVYFFINRAWHARPAMRFQNDAIAILISVFGPDTPFRIHKVPQDILDRQGPHLRRAIQFDSSLAETSSGTVRIISSNSAVATHPAMRNLIANRPSAPKGFGWILVSYWAALIQGLGNIALKLKNFIN